MGLRANWIWVALVFVAGPAFAQEQITWQTDIAKAVKQAKAEKKLVLVHFYGDACAPCKTVEQKVFPQPLVVQAVMKNYVPVKINAEKEQKIAARYGIQGVPTDVFLSDAGQEFHRDLTSQSPADYVTLLDQMAIQTLVGGARQASVRDRETPYALQQYQTGAEQQPQVQQQNVQNQYVARNGGGDNRYAQRGAVAEQAQSQIPGMQQPEEQTVYGGSGGAASTAQPQIGPYGSQQQQPPAQPVAVPGYAPQGGNSARPSSPSMQRANFQDPGDITARQPIRNHFIPVKDAPPIGLEGYCPVTLREGGKWRKGDRQYGAVHRGRTYLFVSAAEQQRFLADPDAYSPILSGADPVIFAERGQLVDGSRNFGVSLPNGGRSEMYFFATPESRDLFEKNPRQYAIHAHQAMLKSETDRKYR
ncbi:MAG: thioredoxin family protein [Pirellulaceae bacterium]